MFSFISNLFKSKQTILILRGSLSMQEVEDFRKQFESKVNLSDTILFCFPGTGDPTIECVNPRLVKPGKYYKTLHLLQEAQEIIDNAKNNINE